MIKFEHLLGREFSLGLTDCYSLVRDFYKDNWGLTLRNYARPNDFWTYDMDLYVQNFKKEGFHSLDISARELEPGDAILMAIRSRHANHAAVVVEGGKIVHHCADRLSTVEDYKGLWRNCTVAFLRHPSVTLNPINPPEVDLLELLPNHARLRYTQKLLDARTRASGVPAEES